MSSGCSWTREVGSTIDICRCERLIWEHVECTVAQFEVWWVEGRDRMRKY